MVWGNGPEPGQGRPVLAFILTPEAAPALGKIEQENEERADSRFRMRAPLAKSIFGARLLCC
jgi:hypothetical protein